VKNKRAENLFQRNQLLQKQVNALFCVMQNVEILASVAMKRHLMMPSTRKLIEKIHWYVKSK